MVQFILSIRWARKEGGHNEKNDMEKFDRIYRFIGAGREIPPLPKGQGPRFYLRSL